MGIDVRRDSTNFLEVGHRVDTCEVVINHPKLNADADGVGHIIFTPAQAMDLANLLIAHAMFCEAIVMDREAKAR